MCRVLILADLPFPCARTSGQQGAGGRDAKRLGGSGVVDGKVAAKSSHPQASQTVLFKQAGRGGAGGGTHFYSTGGEGSGGAREGTHFAHLLGTHTHTHMHIHKCLSKYTHTHTLTLILRSILKLS